MWRSFFLAMGAYVCLLGVETLAVEKVVLKADVLSSAQAGTQYEIVPSDWTPWSLLSSGAVVVLYSFTLPKRVAGGD